MIHNWDGSADWGLTIVSWACGLALVAVVALVILVPSRSAAARVETGEGVHCSDRVRMVGKVAQPYVYCAKEAQ